jgi:hypothetical protein
MVPRCWKRRGKCSLNLENLKVCSNNPHWILDGDFNIITTLAEKKGGTRRLDRDA